ncbi:MAG: hypothetical protein O3B01_15740 [Planctomycetota bacterium]|nr:hypothetical protein [Planctomycetota bacterium]
MAWPFQLVILQIVDGPFNEGSMPAHQVAGRFRFGIHALGLFVEVVAVGVDAEHFVYRLVKWIRVTPRNPTPASPESLTSPVQSKVPAGLSIPRNISPGFLKM